MTHREVIGYLAGSYDAKQRTICICAAYARLYSSLLLSFLFLSLVVVVFVRSFVRKPKHSKRSAGTTAFVFTGA
jgi:hypothetical protein